MIPGRVFKLSVCVVLLFWFPATAEKPWEKLDWGSTISAKLLFHPPQRIELGDREVRFYAREFTYVYLRDSDHWTVTPAQNEISPIEGWGMPGEGLEGISTSKGPLTFGESAPGILEPNLGGCAQRIGRVQLWTREQLSRVWLKKMRVMMHRPTLNPEKLATLISVSDASVADWEEDAKNIWLAIRFYAGEGTVGMGTVVQIVKETCTARVIQAPEFALYSISQVVKAGNNLWLATEDFGESGTGPGIGLARYDLQTGGVEVLSKKFPSLGSHITALARSGEMLWIATIDGFGALDLNTQTLRSWRIVPRIELTKSAPVSSLPGGATRSWIGAGHYEVRWAGEGFVEILTPDCAQGFEESSRFQWLASRSFESSAMAIATSTKWGISGLVLYPTPQERQPNASPTAWFARVPGKPQGKAESGWQPVSVCAGWVEIAGSKIQLTVSPD